MCHAVGVRPALLVVPNYHGQHPLENDRETQSWIRSLQDAGHEVYLHGLLHAASAERVRAFQPGRVFRQRVVSGGEAEFADITRVEAARRLDDGMRVLADAGLRIDGFIPPAWSMKRWLLPMLAERNIAFTEDHLRVYAPARGVQRASVVLNYASRSPARLLSTVAWCRGAKHAATVLPGRLAIHPADMRFVLLRKEIEAMLAWAAPHAVTRGIDLL